MQLKIQNKKAPSLILLQQYFTVPFKLLQKVSYKVSTSDSPHLFFRLTPISLSSLLFHWNYSYQGVLTVPIFLNSIVNTELSYQLYDYTVSPHFETFSTWLLEHSFLHCLLLLCLLCVLTLFLTAKHWSALKLSSHPSSLYYLNTEVKLKKYGDYGLSKCIPNSTNGKIIITRHQGRRKGEEKRVLPPFIIGSLKNYSNNIFSYFLKILSILSNLWYTHVLIFSHRLLFLLFNLSKLKKNSVINTLGTLHSALAIINLWSISFHRYSQFTQCIFFFFLRPIPRITLPRNIAVAHCKTWPQIPFGMIYTLLTLPCG